MHAAARLIGGGVNPARAGMIRPPPPDSLRDTGKPRASGDDPEDALIVDPGLRVNPARAGMIPAIPASESPMNSKPRASGDDPSSELTNWQTTK